MAICPVPQCEDTTKETITPPQTDDIFELLGYSDMVIQTKDEDGNDVTIHVLGRVEE